VLLRDVEKFATENDLGEHLALIQKGALVAQDPANYEDIAGEFALSEEEVEVLRNEVLHKWRQTRTLYLTIITCSIGAAVQGWDQTGSNGANLSMPAFFGIGSTSVHDTLLLGLVNSGPYIGSSFVGCWLADPLNFYLGRRGAIFIAAIFCFLPVIGSAFTQTWWQLLICRLLLGFGMGAKGSTVPIFAAENSPATIRGALVMTWQLWTAFGIFLGYCANLAVAHTGKNAWRLQLGSAMIPAIPLIFFIYACPESPRWYMSKFSSVSALSGCIAANVGLQRRKGTQMHSSRCCGFATTLSRLLATYTTSTRNLKSRRKSSARATTLPVSSSSSPFPVFAVRPSLRSPS
jgi:MFS family permease